MELRFGEVSTVSYNGGVEVEEVRKVREYQDVQNIRKFTVPVRVSSFEEVRSEAEALIQSAESGECLDIALQVQIDRVTGRPKLVKKTHMDIGSKI